MKKEPRVGNVADAMISMTSLLDAETEKMLCRILESSGVSDNDFRAECNHLRAFAVEVVLA